MTLISKLDALLCADIPLFWKEKNMTKSYSFRLTEKYSGSSMGYMGKRKNGILILANNDYLFESLNGPII